VRVSRGESRCGECGRTTGMGAPYGLFSDAPRELAAAGRPAAQGGHPFWTCVNATHLLALQLLGLPMLPKAAARGAWEMKQFRGAWSGAKPAVDPGA
jgi:hypothetical protein